MIISDIHSFSNSPINPSHKFSLFSLLLTTWLIPMDVVLILARSFYLLTHLIRNFVTILKLTFSTLLSSVSLMR